MNSGTHRLTTRVAPIGIGGLIGLVAAGLGCGDPAGSQPSTPVAGTYGAASIMRQQDGVSEELVDRGARFDLDLLADSTVSGQVLLPPNLAATFESEPVNQELSGRWSLRGNQIRLRLDQPVLGNQPTLAAKSLGLVGTLMVPDPVSGTLWLKLLLVRTDP
jgi:hypothetical protein